MKSPKITISNVRSKLAGRKISIFLVVLSYLFFTVFYMGPSVWKCNDTLYGFGDNTAGPVWRMGLEPKQAPLGSFETMTNYPVGENLYSPTNYSLSGQSYAIWAASRTIGPVCGYNVFNMTGFVLSAAVMFGFVYALTKRKWIAWLAGYAVSFSPYYQMKVGGHPGYGYQALLIGAAWAFFNLLKKQRKKDATILGLICAFCFYFDPYFSLLAISIVAPLVLVWLISLALRRRKKTISTASVRQQLQLVARSVVLFGVLLLPLVFVTVKNSHTISTSVAASRGNVFFEARSCSNLPHEYATPFVLNPTFERLVGKHAYTSAIDNLHNGFTCGIGEDTVGISIVVLTVTTIGTIILCWEALNKRKLKLKLGYDDNLVIYGMLAVLVTGVCLGLPPLKLFGVIPTPTYLLLRLTTAWRTLTRLYVTVNFATITLFSIVLLHFSNYLKKYNKLKIIMFAVMFLIIFVEYLSFKPFTGNGLSTFSYKKDVPSSYKWLRDQPDIHVIAEYPLERSGGESNAMAYYLSMQPVHQKKLFNGNIPTTKSELIKDSLKDISDPQTVSVLGSVGVDVVVIHGVDESIVRSITGLEIIHMAKQERFNILSYTPLVKNDNVIIARIRRSTNNQMLQLKKGFVRNTNIIVSAADWNYEAINGSEMDVVPVPGKSTTNMVEALRCFDIKIAGDSDQARVSILADGKVVISELMNSTYRSIKIPAKSKIVIKNDKGFNMEVRNLGCP